MKKVFLAAILLCTTLWAGEYTLDHAHSKVSFKIKHLMISNVVGYFDTFDGTFTYDEKEAKVTALKGQIDTVSINTANKKRDNHLRSADFFDAGKFPQMTFVMTKAEDDALYGNLTIKDVTKEVKLDFENGGSVKDPWGNQKAAFSLEGKINRKDFGLNWNKVLETGGFVVGDVVKMSIEIEGNLK